MSKRNNNRSNNYKSELVRSNTWREFITTEPKKVDPKSTSFFYYQDMLLRKAMSIYKIEGCPETWDIDYILQKLLVNGFIAITDTPAGVLPLECGISGVNVFNHPTTVNIANPVIGSLKRTIDEDCSLVKLQYNYRGIVPILTHYATQLSDCDSSIAVNLMNSKVTFIGLVGSNNQAQSMKLMYDQISKGEPAVYVKGDQISQDSIFYNHVKENFIASDVQLLKRKIMSEFLTEIGINNTNTDKRERLTDNEVEANDHEIQLNSSYWLDNIKEGIEKANKMFNLNIKVSLKDFYNTETEDIRIDKSSAAL